MIRLAIKAAKDASDISLRFFNKRKMVHYKQMEEIVTDVDVKTEQSIRSAIKQKFPNHSILGEEGGYQQNSSEYLWIIDPIDGTVNYSRGIRLYGISIACAKNKEVVLGVVYNPITKELFAAEKGKGALLNGKKIAVSATKELSKSVIYSTELYKTKDIVARLFDKVKNFRITSSSAYETCLVACARTDGFIKVTTHPWGFAAACLIVEEAGGTVTNFDGSAWSIDSQKILISNGILHQEIARLLNQ